MKPITPFIALLLFGFGLCACSSESEPRKDPFAPVGKPAPAVAPTLPPSDAYLFRRNEIVGFGRPFEVIKPAARYAITGCLEAKGVELVNVKGRRELYFRFQPRLWDDFNADTTVKAQHQRYVKAYGDRIDSIPPGFSHFLFLVVNIDKVQIVQYDPERKRYSDVSQNYALIYSDPYDYVCTSPRLAYAMKFWRINEVVRRLSDCDRNVCRWAFNESVPTQIQPLEGAEPNENTSLVITLSGGQQIRTAWTDTVPERYDRVWWKKYGNNLYDNKL